MNKLSARCVKCFGKLYNEYDNLSAPLKVSMWFAICNILQKGISMITVPIFTRLLTTSQYGVYSIYQSWYAIISIFATLNISAGVINNGMIKYEKDKERFISSMQGLSSFLTIGLFIVYICGLNFWNNILDLSTVLVTAMFCQLLFEPAYLFWSAKQRFEYKYKKLVLVTLLIVLSSPLMGIVAVLSTKYKAEARILSFVLVQVCIGLVFYTLNVKRGKYLFNNKYWKFTLFFNIPLIPHYLASSVLCQSDRIMISQMVGTDKAAIYSIVYNISSILTLITSAINSSFIPYTYKAMKEKMYRQISENANRLIIFIGVSTLLAMFVGPELIKIFAPSEYYEAIWIIPPVIASVYFTFLYQFFANIEFYFEESKYVMVASVFGAIANIFLNWILIPQFGYMVAGYTTLFCYMLFSITHSIFMMFVLKKHIPGYKIYNMKFILRISLVYLCLTFLITLLYYSNHLRWGTFVFLILVSIIKRKPLTLIVKEIFKMKK